MDTHVHVNEPGRTEWEGFATATRAAAAGGVTTIVDMPLNSIPPTTSTEALEAKRAAAEGAVHVDVGFWGGAVPENLGHLRELHEAGVFGFKCFLCPSGVDEFPSLRSRAAALGDGGDRGFDGLLIVHAELPEPIERATEALADADPRAYATYVASRPPEAEERAVDAVIDASTATGLSGTRRAPVSAAAALEAIARRSRRASRPRRARTTSRSPPRRSSPAPPSSSARRRSARRRTASDCGRASREGRLVAVVSDHSPCTPELKAGTFFEAWGGIASLQLGLRAVWTEARRRGFTARGHRVVDERRPGSRSPASSGRARSREGKDADLVVFDPGCTSGPSIRTGSITAIP